LTLNFFLNDPQMRFFYKNPKNRWATLYYDSIDIYFTG
jgi:hypothetical protein